MICHVCLKILSQCSKANVVCLITLHLHTSPHFIIHNGSQGIQHYINPHHIYPNRRQGLSFKKLQLKNNRDLFLLAQQPPPPSPKNKDCYANKKNIFIFQLEFHYTAQWDASNNKHHSINLVHKYKVPS